MFGLSGFEEVYGEVSPIVLSDDRVLLMRDGKCLRVSGVSEVLGYASYLLGLPGYRDGKLILLISGGDYLDMQDYRESE
jgi:hypothetical protein